MNKPLVSVVIPVYNGENYIEKCINSILCQTYSNYEILIIDDGSVDRTTEILENYKTNNKINIIRKINEGQGIARNVGIEAAKGDYIFFIDVDDYIENIMFEEMINKIKLYGLDTCVCNWNTVFLENSKIIQHELCLEERLYKSDEIRNIILKNILCSDMKNKVETSIPISVTKALYSLEIIKRNNIRFISEREVFSEDLIFNFNYYKYCKSVYLVDKPFYNYVVSKESYSHKYQSNYIERAKKSYSYLMNELPDKDDDDKKRISLRFLSYVVVCLKQEKVNHFKNKKHNFKIICADKTVQEALNNIKGFNNFTFKKKIIYKLLKNKMVIILLLLI